MRTAYRELRHECGNHYMEVDVFPIFKESKNRRKKYKLSSETQKLLNQHTAERKLSMLIKTNFDRNDIKCELSYDDKHRPLLAEDAAKILSNFIRRLKRFRLKLKLPDLKYITVTERGKRSGRYHHHIIISGGVSPRELADLWGQGYVQKIQPLQFNETGVVGIAVYMCKQMIFGKRWNASRNLKNPDQHINDHKYSKRKAAQLVEQFENPEIFEKLYPNWCFANCKVLQNHFNKGIYLTIQLYKPFKYRKT